MAGGRRWVPVSTGTTGATHNRHSRHGANPRRGPAMGSRLHGNDGRNPQSSFPRRRESMAGGRRWVPVSTGTTGATHNRHSRHGANPRRGPAMGSRLHGNDGRNPQSSFPPRRESTAGGRRRWVPVSTGTTGATHNRHSHHGANPRPNIVIPAQAGIHGGGGGRRRWVPVSTGTTGATHNRHSHHGANPRPNIVIPAQAGIHGGGGGPAAMGSRLHGNDGRTHNRHSRHGANPRRGAGGDGFPSPRERRAHPQSSFPPRRESTAGGAGGDGFPSPRERRAHPTIVIPAQAGIHGGEGGDGFPSPRERRAHPQSSFPPRRESTAPHRHSRAGGNDGPAARRVLASSLIEWRRSGAAR